MFLEIISPEKTIFSGEVNRVNLPGKDGYFEILKNHAPLISLLSTGEIKVTKSNGEKENFRSEFGFVEVLNNNITVLI